MDAQLPPLLARRLAEAGHVTEHVFELGELTASDETIWQLAKGKSAAIITKDEDFATMRLTRAAGPSVVWLRVGDCSNEALVSWFQPMLDDAVKQLERGETFIELI